MPDIVILNGKLLTMAGADAEALAITGGKIEAVGTTEEIHAMAGGARLIDAGGCTVLPGFIDSHVHLFTGSAALDYLNLMDVEGMDALTKAVRAYSTERPDDPLLFASCIDYHVIEGRAATRHDLDRVMPDRPFAAMAADHHTVWANTRALEMAGLLHGGDLPEGSEVVERKSGV